MADSRSSNREGDDKMSKLRAGTISRIVVKNFMCHSYLEVLFNNNTFFLTGRNGSGKSAILTALIVGLGGKASLTSRATKFSDFIKTGASSATVEIILRNIGLEAYKPDLYGPEITIIKSITASGHSTLKILSSSGNIISHHAQEIQRICCNFNIQIDNPVCLLNQDTARTFLNTEDPKQKYILFSRATGLNVVLEQYAQSEANCENAKKLFKEKQVELSTLNQEVKELEYKIECLRNVVQLKEKIHALNTEMAWSKVAVIEIEQQQQQEICNDLAKKLQTLDKQAKETLNQNSTFEKTTQTYSNQLRDLNSKLNKEYEKQAPLVKLLSDLKQKIYENNRDKCSLLKEIARKTGEYNILEEAIKKLTANSEAAKVSEADKLKQITELKNRIIETDSRERTYSNELFQMRSSINHNETEQGTLTSHIRQANSKIGDLTTKINHLRSNTSNTLSLYGSDMSRIIELIEREKSNFVHPPRGPIGSYVSLKDKKWALAIEQHLSSSLLRAFVVDNKKDNELLINIFRRVCRDEYSIPPIITSKFFFKVHNVGPNLVRPINGCVSIYDMLIVSDPVVMNCLIDQTSLENVLLIPNNNVAFELMSEARRVPANCVSGVTVEGDVFYPDPNYRFYACPVDKAQYLQVAPTDVIRQLESEIGRLRNDKDSVGKELALKQHETQAKLKNANEIENKIRALQKELLMLKREYRELDTTETDNSQMFMMKKDLLELKETIEKANLAVQALESELPNAEEKTNTAEGKLEESKKSVCTYEAKIDELEKTLSANQVTSREFLAKKESIIRSLNELKDRVQVAQTDREERDILLEASKSNALKIGKKPDEVRESCVIMADLKKYERLVKKSQSFRENVEELASRFQYCSNLHKEGMTNMKLMGENIKHLQECRTNCMDHYVSYKDYVTTHIKQCFTKTLKHRHYAGYLDIDFSNQTLKFMVTPREGTENNTTVTNLSGGERSYSSFAFLHALWQCLGFPFCILDEFDVFMDTANRTRAIQELVAHAKLSPNLQFIFLTPQDVSFLNDKAVTILRMTDPTKN